MEGRKDWFASGKEGNRITACFVKGSTRFSRKFSIYEKIKQINVLIYSLLSPYNKSNSIAEKINIKTPGLS